MSQKASQLVKALLGPERLEEGTIVILNGDAAENAAALDKLGSIGGVSVGHVAKDQDTEDRKEPTEKELLSKVKNQFNVKRGGKHWHFVIHRNSDGQISEIEVTEK